MLCYAMRCSPAAPQYNSHLCVYLENYYAKNTSVAMLSVRVCYHSNTKSLYIMLDGYAFAHSPERAWYSTVHIRTCAITHNAIFPKTPTAHILEYSVKCVSKYIFVICNMRGALCGQKV